MNLGGKMVSKLRKSINPLQSVRSSRSQFVAEPADSMGSDIVSALATFADIGGSVAVDYFDNAVAKDKLIQTQRAWRGQLPTSDATTGGRKAASVVGANLASAKSYSQLKDLASQDLTDEEFEEATGKVWDATREEVLGKYEGSEELDKAMLVEMQNSMPSLVAAREKGKIERDLVQRTDDIRDTFILTAQDNPEMLGLVLERSSGAMQLTDVQTEGALVDAIANSDDPALIDLAKTVMNKNGVSLYDRTGAIKNKDKQVKADEARVNAGESIRRVEEMNDLYINGDLTRIEYEGAIQEMKEETGGAYPTQGQIESIHRKATTAEKNADSIAQTTMAVNNSKGEYVPNDLPPKAQQQLLDNQFNSYLEDGLDLEVAIRKTIADGNKLATTSKTFENSLTSFVNVNVDANTLTEDNVTSFNKEIQDFADTVEAFPPEDFDEYAGAKGAKILNAYTLYRSQGLSASAALKQAQVSARNNVPQNQTVLRAAVEEAVDEINTIFSVGDNVPDFQNSYISNIVQGQLSLHNDPSSDIAKSQVNAYTAKNLTVLSDVTLKGSPTKIASAIGINEDHIEKYHDSTLSFFKTDLDNKTKGTGMETSQAWVDIDFKTGMGTIMLPNFTTDISFPAVEMKDHYKSVTRKKAAEDKAKRKANIQNSLDNYGTYGIKPITNNNPWGTF